MGLRMSGTGWMVVQGSEVTDSYDWPWSSLSLYLNDKGREWLQKQWVKYSPPDDGEGWDDDEMR